MLNTTARDQRETHGEDKFQIERKTSAKAAENSPPPSPKSKSMEKE